MKEHYRKKAKELKLPNAYTAALKEYMQRPATDAAETKSITVSTI